MLFPSVLISLDSWNYVIDRIVQSLKNRSDCCLHIVGACSLLWIITIFNTSNNNKEVILKYSNMAYSDNKHASIFLISVRTNKIQCLEMDVVMISISCYCHLNIACLHKLQLKSTWHQQAVLWFSLITVATVFITCLCGWS